MNDFYEDLDVHFSKSTSYNKSTTPLFLSQRKMHVNHLISL